MNYFEQENAHIAAWTKDLPPVEPKPVKEMSDIYHHLKGKLNFHETARDNHMEYHRKEADDIRHCLNWLEVKHNLRKI